MIKLGRNSANWLFLVFAVVAGGLAFWLSRVYLHQQEERMREELGSSQKDLRAVIVASSDLTPGAVISTKTVAQGKMPANRLGALTLKPADFEKIAGMVLNRPVSAGEVLRADYLTGAVALRFSDLLDPGTRAVSLEVSDLQSNAGMTVPGDYVDLYVLIKPVDSSVSKKASGSDKVLIPVLERVKVLAVGDARLNNPNQDYRQLGEREARYSIITVGVGVEDAERLLLAQDLGDMAYLLRQHGDQKLYVASSADSSLFGDPSSRSLGGSYRYLSNIVTSADTRPLVQLGGGSTGALSLPIYRAAEATAATPDAP